MFETDRRPEKVITVCPDETLQQAAAKMLSHNVGCLIVNDDQGRFVGLVTERDIAHRVATSLEQGDQPIVADIMTDEVLCVRPDQSVTKCMALMTDKRVRHLPVIEKNQLTGVISIGDVVQAIISEQEFIIDQLENYITGIR